MSRKLPTSADLQPPWAVASDIDACAEGRRTQKIPEAWVFPESYIAAEFWSFVEKRAYDVNLDYKFGHALGHLDEDRKRYQERQYDLATTRRPTLYTTVQQALIDFLIYFVNYSSYALTYEIWLRTVTLVIAQTQRQPQLLTVETPIAAPQNRSDAQMRPTQLRPHTMWVAEDQWDCLSRDTYDYVVRTFPYGTITNILEEFDRRRSG